MKPLVTVILTHHINENQPYLDLCTKSLCDQQDIDFEVMLVSSAPEAPHAPDGIQIYHRPDLDNATKKAHWATENAMPDSKYFLFLSDDVMLSKYCIRGLVDAVKEYGFICNPLSNNEMGSRFITDLTLTNSDNMELGLRPNMDLTEIAGFEQAVLDYPHTKPFSIPVGWLSFFCTLIPKEAWKTIGQLDERLDTRHNDEDFCRRAIEKRIYPIINLGVFALHFGGKTLPFTCSMDDRNRATEIFKEKWKLSL